ncbi:ABC transporter permease [Glutamicibacter arilaitensis]|uniref:ABC transporter permease n=1 Tax=Glutamicibacter arilaitensis TaxID=256701 RepID=UPI00384C1AB3
MVRFMLRRDRVRLGVWTASIVFFYAYFVVALGAMGDPALAGRALIMETPSGIAMGGPGYGIENYTVGVAIANEGITWMVMGLAIMSILHIVRHTRGEEESGRSELVLARAVGRHAPAVAAALTLFLVNAVIAIVSALALSGVGGDELPLGDSFALTVGSGLGAMVFGAIALVAAQVTERGRGAVGISLAAFGLAFMIRAAGDIQQRQGSSLSWFSPIAWPQQMRPFVDVRWWPAALCVVAIVLFLLVGAFLGSRRDFGGGLIAVRAGRSDARGTLRGPATLAWLQQRTALICCALGLGLMWFASGTLLPDITSMISEIPESNPVFAAVFGEDPGQFTTAFLGVMILFAMLCCAAYAVVMGQRPKAEEGAGRAEIALATSVSRYRWFASQLLVAALGTGMLAAVSIWAMWLGAVSVGYAEQTFADYTGVLWPYLVALASYLGFATVLYAWIPRASGAGWVLLIYTFVIGMFGGLLQDLPDWVHGISPFYWLPAAFTEQPDIGYMLGLAGVAVLLFALGFVGFRRRDVPTT